MRTAMSPLKNKTILVISDNTDFKTGLTQILRSLGYIVEFYSTFIEGESRIKNGNKIHSLIVDVDLQVQGIDGVSFSHKYRSDYPIIIVSCDHNELQEVKDEGFVTFNKDWELGTIYPKIKRAQREFENRVTIIDTREGLETVQKQMTSMNTQITNLESAMNIGFNELKGLFNNASFCQYADKSDKPCDHNDPENADKKAMEIISIFSNSNMIGNAIDGIKFLFLACFKFWKTIITITLVLLLWNINQIIDINSLFKNKEPTKVVQPSQPK